MKTAIVLAFLPAFLFVPTGASLAQVPGDPQRGREFSMRLCTACHVTDRQTSGPVRTDVPSFPTIADRSGVTAEHLAGRIIVPHPAMPGVPLTAAEIRDIVAYILSLRRLN